MLLTKIVGLIIEKVEEDIMRGTIFRKSKIEVFFNLKLI